MEMTLIKFYASLQFLPALLAHHWWWLAVLFLAVALLGRRVYCRFICPLGILQSLVHGFRGRRRICSRLDGVALKNKPNIIVRLILLALVVVLGLVGAGWQWLDPYAIVCRAIAFAFSPEFDWIVAVFALVPICLILILALVAGGRIWCNWACPVGTILALVGIRPWKGDNVKKCAGCDKCRRCFK